MDLKSAFGCPTPTSSITPTTPSSMPFEVSLKLLMYHIVRSQGILLDPRLTLVLNMQNSLFIAATEALIMSVNINCAHPLAIIECSDQCLVHNDKWDNQCPVPFSPDLQTPLHFVVPLPQNGFTLTRKPIHHEVQCFS